MPTPEQSAAVLKKAKFALDSLEIPFCLFLGTALGAYRDHNFCTGDTDDIDLAIDIKYFPRMDEIKERLGMKVNLEWNPDGFCPEVSFKTKWDDKTYTKIDLFFLSENDDKKYWRFYLDETGKEYITKSINKKHFDTFDKIEFFGEEFNLPGYIEEYLEANYGDWQTPIPRDKWNWQTDNQCASA